MDSIERMLEEDFSGPWPEGARPALSTEKRCRRRMNRLQREKPGSPAPIHAEPNYK